MAKYSRMKKYENYRNQIQMGNEDSLASDDLKEFSSRLNRIDASIANDIPTQNRSNSASRVKHYDTPVNTNPTVAQAKQQAQAVTVNEAKNEPFKNEYLDEFLDEVKKYNVEQGYANDENTQVNIFSQLNGQKPTPKTNNTIESYNNGNELFENTSASATVSNDQELMSEKQLEQVQESVKDKRNSITQELQTLLSQATEENNQETEESAQIPTIQVQSKPIEKRNQQLLEQTAKQTVRLSQAYDELDEDLDDMESRMGKNTRLVNFILVLIVLALIVVLVVIVYAILIMKGLIG